MDRTLLTYHPAAAFAAGRIVDRLTLRLGEESITVVHPGSRPGPTALAEVLAEHAALLLVVPARQDGTHPEHESHVHLAASVALRRNRPILVLEITGEGSDSPTADGAADEATGIVRVAVDPDQLDRDGSELMAHVERWLSATGRIPRIEIGETMVPAFVGLTERLPVHEADDEWAPRLVTSWRQYEALYAGFGDGMLLPAAVDGWFQNGGGACYICPIRPPHDGDQTSGWGRAYAGSEQTGTGIVGLARIEDDVTALVLPDLAVVCRTDDGATDLNLWKAIQIAAINHAEAHGRIALLDPPPGMSPQQVHDWRTDFAMYDSRSACLHYPWIVVHNPAPAGPPTVEVPPSGHIAGTWARSDRDRGVWRSPANQVVRGALRPAVELTASERFVLAGVGINPIRVLGRDGIRTWGSQTLSSDPWFAGLEVSRFVDALLRACSAGLRWATFEPDGAVTRSSITRQLEEFLVGLWRAGALVGASPGEAFFVDAGSTDDDRLMVTIGIQPSEGIYIRLGFGERFGEYGGVLG